MLVLFHVEAELRGAIGAKGGNDTEGTGEELRIVGGGGCKEYSINIFIRSYTHLQFLYIFKGSMYVFRKHIIRIFFFQKSLFWNTICSVFFFE